MPLAVRRYLLMGVALWIILTGNAPSGTPPEATYCFGLSLNTGLNNQLFTLFLVKMDGLHVVQQEPITREQFVLQAQGVVPSMANPDRENLFRKFNVVPCAHPDTTKYYLDCPVLEDLWRLRFKEYPFHTEHRPEGEGWAGIKGTPTPQQMVILADYGLVRLNGMIRCQDVFRLLSHVSDSTWVEKYRGGS